MSGRLSSDFKCLEKQGSLLDWTPVKYCKTLFILRTQGLNFRVNSREHIYINAKIKSLPIFSIIRNIKEDMMNRENKVS